LWMKPDPRGLGLLLSELLWGARDLARAAPSSRGFDADGFASAQVHFKRSKADFFQVVIMGPADAVQLAKLDDRKSEFCLCRWAAREVR